MGNKNRLVKEIARGESKTLEFNEALPKGDQLAKTFAAAVCYRKSILQMWKGLNSLY